MCLQSHSLDQPRSYIFQALQRHFYQLSTQNSMLHTPHHRQYHTQCRSRQGSSCEQEDSVEQHATPAQHLQPQEIFSPAASASVPGPQQLQPSTPAAPGLTTHLPLPSLVGLE